MQVRSSDIKVFSPGGDFLKNIAGPGEGPGLIKAAVGSGDLFSIKEISEISYLTPTTLIPGGAYFAEDDIWISQVKSARREAND